MVEAKIKALRDELERHNYNYYVLSAPTISDFEFDKMMKELQELEANRTLLEQQLEGKERKDTEQIAREIKEASGELEEIRKEYMKLLNTYE